MFRPVILLLVIHASILPAGICAAADSLLPSATPDLDTAPLTPAFTGNTGGLNTRAISSVLPADQAFALQAFIEAPDTIVLSWEIQPGYYLYEDSIRITPTTSQITLESNIPAGQKINDEFFGEVSVFFDKLLVKTPVPATALSEIDNGIFTFELNYQGCAEKLYCYPVQHKLISLELPR